MKKSITCLMVFCFFSVKSQPNFRADTLSAPLFPEIANGIKSISKPFDFQLRIWETGGLLYPFQKELLVLSLRNGKWKWEGYIFSCKKNLEIVKKPVRKLKYRKAKEDWDFFTMHGILDLPDMKELKKDFYVIVKPEIRPAKPDNDSTLIFKNIVGEVKVECKKEIRKIVEVCDGIGYCFEFIGKQKYRNINYYSPKEYAEVYTHIPELKMVSEIVNYIQSMK